MLSARRDHWMLSWHGFEGKLQAAFGHVNPVGDATTKMMYLQMKDSDKITLYNTKFTQFATTSGWDKRALMVMYKKGLCERLKDNLSQVPPPQMLAAFKEAVI